MTQNIKGVVAGKTYVILNGMKEISPISHYVETHKDEFGKKIKIKHAFFVIDYGGESIRFERERKDHIKPRRDINNTHCLEIYVDETLSDLRNRLISELLKIKR